MSALIKELKKDHSEIVTALNEVKKLGILSEEGQNILVSIKALLITHLKKEDKQLYPFLKKEAENNKLLKDALDLCAIEMENISRNIQEFFDKYSRGVLGKEPQREFENHFSGIGKRIKNEEDILYGEYEIMNK